MNLDDLINKLPDYAYDMKQNLSNVLSEEGSPELSQKEIAAVSLATALTTSSKTLIKTMEDFSAQYLSETEMKGAKTAHALMSMTNVYYRFLHQADNSDYGKMPSKLQMKARKNPGIDKKSYEFAALGVSAINNCKVCVDFHERSLRELGASVESIQSCVRIAAVICSVGELLKFSN